MEQSVQLVKLWATLDGIKKQLDNVAIPLGGYLGLNHPELMAAMEELSAQIAAHFDGFKLVAIARRSK